MAGKFTPEKLKALLDASRLNSQKKNEEAIDVKVKEIVGDKIEEALRDSSEDIVYLNKLIKGYNDPQTGLRVEGVEEKHVILLKEYCEYAPLVQAYWSKICDDLGVEADQHDSCALVTAYKSDACEDLDLN
ncbi:MAG: hypothetical protein ACHP6I_03555 [Rickettsiales bacterium]